MPGPAAVLSVAAPEPKDFTSFKEYERHVIAWAQVLEKGLGVDSSPDGDPMAPRATTQAAVGSAHQAATDLPWSHVRVPLEPSPYHYATLEAYEAAVLAWRDAVLAAREPLPPVPYSLRGLKCFEPAAQHVKSDAAAARARAGATKAPFGYCGAVAGGGLALESGMTLKRVLLNAIHSEAKKALPRLKKGFKDCEGHVVMRPTVTKARVEVDWTAGDETGWGVHVVPQSYGWFDAEWIDLARIGQDAAYTRHVALEAPAPAVSHP